MIGALNTDIIAAGLDEFARPNAPVYGGAFRIGPGGKPGNMARMAGHLSGPGRVAIIRKTVKDTNGLWQYPAEGLREAGVNIDFVTILNSSQTAQHPSIAMVAVKKNGDNLCFILPGISQEFSPTDVEAAESLFVSAGRNRGIFILSLECPLPTAERALELCKQHDLKVVIDPGGIMAGADITKLISTRPYLIKPNEYEARIITGIEITDFDSARLAADKLRGMGAQNVLITHGAHGAYLFAGDQTEHIPIPEVEGEIRDAPGCGDQTTATLCVYLQAGQTLFEAAKTAIMAGTLEFHKLGCQPLTKAEIESQL